MSATNDKIMKLERERDALAAQFSEMASLADSLTYASSEDEADEIVQKIAGLVHDEGGAIARRDLLMKAEALDDFAKNLCGSDRIFAKQAAESYREQAEGE